MIGNFDTHKWFKKQYLEEANINEEIMSKENAFRALRDIEANMAKWRGPEGENYRTLMGRALDSLQAAEVTAMMDRERNT